MSYILGGINLDDFSVIPSWGDGTNLGLVGCFDMPARLGKCFHDWGDEHGVEPYVRGDEIRFGGRDIVFTCLMQAQYENELLRKLYGLYDDLLSENSLMTFQTDLGNFDVYLKDEIQAEYLDMGWAKLRFLFRQPVIPVVGTEPTADNALYGIDGCSFQSLGLKILDVEGRHYLPGPKGMTFTAYQTEGYQITKHSQREITIKALLIESDLNGFQTKINSLSKLLSKSGLRTLTYQKDALRTFFVKDGFQVRQVWKTSGDINGVVTIKCVQVGSTMDWNFLQTNNRINITKPSGETISIN